MVFFFQLLSYKNSFVHSSVIQAKIWNFLTDHQWLKFQPNLCWIFIVLRRLFWINLIAPYVCHWWSVAKVQIPTTLRKLTATFIKFSIVLFSRRNDYNWKVSVRRAYTISEYLESPRTRASSWLAYRKKFVYLDRKLWFLHTAQLKRTFHGYLFNFQKESIFEIGNLFTSQQ